MCSMQMEQVRLVNRFSHVRLANELARLGSFWLVRITSQLGSARYLNEPKSQLGSARYELELAR
jgi:hypothetical protein